MFQSSGFRFGLLHVQNDELNIVSKKSTHEGSTLFGNGLFVVFFGFWFYTRPRAKIISKIFQTKSLYGIPISEQVRLKWRSKVT